MQQTSKLLYLIIDRYFVTETIIMTKLITLTL